MNTLLESKTCLSRILERIDLSELSVKNKATFTQRLDEHFPALFNLLVEVYEGQYDLHFHLESLVKQLASNFGQRSATLKKKDQNRIAEPLWYKSEKMLGMACYVDLVADDLKDLKNKIPYYKSLGVNYLHLMPLYQSPEGENDGGYAVTDYRQVDSKLGTTKDLQALAKAMHKEGISLVLDFVFNHTADNHNWATLAKSGDEVYQNYYYMFDDRTMPDRYEETIREIFPQVRRGSFTLEPETQKWVWTTFNSFQWDLNYSNPAVFTAIVDEMLYLANLGCDVLRLDALAFIWKQVGTHCESQPNAHKLIKAFNVCLRIAAPSVLFKSEAIVHPDEVVQYIGQDECQLSYNPLLMALIWNSLATRKTKLLNQSLSHRFEIDPNCSWVNYARCHDDIGWTFDDGDAGHIGVNAHDHRYFLNQYYTGKHSGSFATGVPFQENPTTGDCRVCGSLASLAGLEKALQSNNELEIEHSLKRIVLIHAILLSIGGIPLLYQGDELATLNDYSYQDDPSKVDDARWVNRPKLKQQQFNNLDKEDSIESKVFYRLKEMVEVRQQHEIFGDAKTRILFNDNQHILSFARDNELGTKLLVLVNFSEYEQRVSLPDTGKFPIRDLLNNNRQIDNTFGHVSLQPYQVMWLMTE
jgi:amylosucrase